MYLEGVNFMETKNDIEMILAAKSSDEKTASDARLALWNKYQFFIQKKYYQWLNTFSREHVDFEDFMQESFIAFMHALELCDINRMQEKNVKAFSTVLYFQLLKIKNRYDIHYEQYGPIYSYSEIAAEVESSLEDQFSGSNTLAGQWINATTVDSEDEQRQHMYENLISEYEMSLDDTDRRIWQLMVEKNRVSSIIAKVSDLTESVVRRKVSDIKRGFRSYIEANAYV